MKKIIIFDMDGTLIDSKRDITISINYIRHVNHKLPPLDEDFIVEAINAQERNLAMLFYETLEYEARDKVLFESHYLHQCVQNPVLYDGVYTTLQKLFNAGCKLSVATNAPTLFAQKMLTHLGVNLFFDCIVGADKVSLPKPSPLMLEHILTHYTYNPSSDQAWMVGDNTKDMQSAKAASIDALFATWGFSPNAAYYPPIAHPKELLEIVL